MGKRSDYKKYDTIADNDLNAGCRRHINTSTPTRRRLRDKLRRMSRKQIERKLIKLNDERADCHESNTKIHA